MIFRMSSPYNIIKLYFVTGTNRNVWIRRIEGSFNYYFLLTFAYVNFFNVIRESQLWNGFNSDADIFMSRTQSSFHLSFENIEAKVIATAKQKKENSFKLMRTQSQPNKLPKARTKVREQVVIGLQNGVSFLDQSQSEGKHNLSNYKLLSTLS